jgi:CSLREA domain-containing protein
MRAAILAIVFALARVAAADVTVDTTVDADDAACSLREAIVAANTDADYHGCVEVLSKGVDRVVGPAPRRVRISAGREAPTPSENASGTRTQDSARCVCLTSSSFAACALPVVGGPAV